MIRNEKRGSEQSAEIEKKESARQKRQTMLEEHRRVRDSTREFRLRTYEERRQRVLE